MIKKNSGCGCGGKCGNPKCGPKRNPAQVKYDSDDYKRGLFQGAVEKGKAPPPRGTSAELQRGYAAGARIAAAQPKALAKAMGVYEVTSDQVRAGQALQDAVLDHDPVANPSGKRQRAKAKLPNPFEVIDGELYEDGRHIPRMTPAEAKKAYAAPKCSGYLCGKPATMVVSASFGGTAPFCAKHAAEERRLLKKRKNPRTERERLEALVWSNTHRDFRGKFPDGTKTILQFVPGMGTCLVPVSSLSDQELKNRLPSAAKEKHSIRNPMSAAERKHCAHERSEERSFASLLNKLPEGETVTLGGRRVRKLSKGFVVVDGERLPAKQAAAKIHRGR